MHFSVPDFKDGRLNARAHYIRESILDTIVLHNLETVTAFAREQPGRILCNGNEERRS